MEGGLHPTVFLPEQWLGFPWLLLKITYYVIRSDPFIFLLLTSAMSPPYLFCAAVSWERFTQQDIPSRWVIITFNIMFACLISSLCMSQSS